MKKKKSSTKDEFEKLSLVERREFLKYFSGFLALPFVSDHTRRAMQEMVFGSQAFAQTITPINFLEVNFRDQWDFQCLFVPPGLAQSYDSVKSRLPAAGEPTAEKLNFYLTPNAASLRPHLDNIAVMELGDVCVGNVHAHEAANPMRSPGRSYNQTTGKKDMATVDKRPGGRSDGNEVYYSSTPTPLILHNYYQKSQKPDLINGVILRSSLRTSIHTYYHFEGNLANAQADRFFDKTTFLNSFSSPLSPDSSLSSQKHALLISRLLKRIDRGHLERTLASAQLANHRSKIDSLGSLLSTAQDPITLALTSSEESYWKTGIIDQVLCPGDNANNCVAEGGKWHPGELFAYAGKLFRSGRVRSVGIDFDLSDVHTNRTKFMMDTQAQQSGMTLARLISYLKANNLWDHTLIAMYTLDGSRSPDSNSTGQDSKNAVVLAGGMIQGGYYGDIRLVNGNFTYYRPDDNGTPISNGTSGGGMRVPAADVYKTVLTAAGVPTTLINSFPDAQPGKVLSYMLRP